MKSHIELSEKVVSSIVNYLAELIRIQVDVEKKYTLKEVGKATGTNKSTVWRWRQKDVTPDLNNVFKAILFLGGSIMEAIKGATTEELCYIIGILEKDSEITKKIKNVMSGPYLETFLEELSDLDRMTTRKKNLISA
jgi:hypothetical protein